MVPSHRGRGLATRLYRTLFDDIGHTKAVLTVLEDNLPAIGFYQRLGWETIQAGFVSSGGNGSYLILGLSLEPTDPAP